MKTYLKDFKIKEGFPIEEGEIWHVREGNHVVEKWVVDWVGEKKTKASIEITEYVEDENGM